MDGNRFDRFARMLATSTSRRTALGRGGAAGVAALLGVGQQRVRAQEATPAAQTSVVGSDGKCLVPFEVTIRQGPSAGWRAQGVVAMIVDADGHIDGSFLLYDGTEIPVSGQATGRAVTLIVALPNGGRLYGTGGADADVTSCAFTDMGGPVVGPQPGDFGDWVVLRNAGDVTIGDVCFIGDPDCPPLIEPTDDDDGVGDYEPPDPCDGPGYEGCPEFCEAAGLSGDCDAYCAETFFCG